MLLVWAYDREYVGAAFVSIVLMEKERSVAAGVVRSGSRPPASAPSDEATKAVIESAVPGAVSEPAGFCPLPLLGAWALASLGAFWHAMHHAYPNAPDPFSASALFAFGAFCGALLAGSRGRRRAATRRRR